MSEDRPDGREFGKATLLVEIGGQPVTSAAAGDQADLSRRAVEPAALQSRPRGRSFETPVIIAPAEKPITAENYLRVVGLIYLFIGIFIFVRRWNAPRAVHFYVFCLVSFVLYTFHYSGKLDAFDYEVYWASIVARLLAPTLLLHFALVFPERSESTRKHFARLSLVYGPPLLLFLLHLSVASETLGILAVALCASIPGQD